MSDSDSSPSCSAISLSFEDRSSLWLFELGTASQVERGTVDDEEGEFDVSRQYPPGAWKVGFLIVDEDNRCFLSGCLWTFWWDCQLTTCRARLLLVCSDNISRYGRLIDGKPYALMLPFLVVMQSIGKVPYGSCFWSSRQAKEQTRRQNLVDIKEWNERRIETSHNDDNRTKNGF